MKFVCGLLGASRSFCLSKSALKEIDKSNLVISVIKGSGKGGSKRNQIRNCVQIYDKVNKVLVKEQGSRNLDANYKKAFKNLQKGVDKVESNYYEVRRQETLKKESDARRRKRISLELLQTKDEVTADLWARIYPDDPKYKITEKQNIQKTKEEPNKKETDVKVIYKEVAAKRDSFEDF